MLWGLMKAVPIYTNDQRPICNACLSCDWEYFLIFENLVFSRRIRIVKGRIRILFFQTIHIQDSCKNIRKDGYLEISRISIILDIRFGNTIFCQILLSQIESNWKMHFQSFDAWYSAPNLNSPLKIVNFHKPTEVSILTNFDEAKFEK